MTRYLWRIRIIPYVCWHRAAEKNALGGWTYGKHRRQLAGRRTARRRALCRCLLSRAGSVVLVRWGYLGGSVCVGCFGGGSTCFRRA